LDYGDNKLPFASAPPNTDDFLPLESDEDNTYRVGHDLLLPPHIDQSRSFFENREFTALSPYAATIQATYLLNLTTHHVLDVVKDPISRGYGTTKLDMALQSFGSSLIPPPGKAAGSYCGAYSIHARLTLTLRKKFWVITSLTFVARRFIFTTMSSRGPHSKEELKKCLARRPPSNLLLGPLFMRQMLQASTHR